MSLARQQEMAPGSRASFALAALSALTASALLSASSARACSGVWCSKTGLLPPAGGSVPANAVELIWRPSNVSAGEFMPELRLYVLERGARRALSFDLSGVPGDRSGSLRKIVPRGRLAEGSDLVVETQDVCEPGPTPVTSALRVGPAAPDPSSLGSLEIESQAPDTIPLWVTSGECYRLFAVASARVRIALSASARPFADLLRYELHVDGLPSTTQEAARNWQEQPPLPVGASVLGRGTDRIYHVCGVDAGAATSGWDEGSHRLQMFALLPDGGRLESDELTVELRCTSAAASSDAGAFADAAAAPPQAAMDAGDSESSAGSADARDGIDAGAAAMSAGDSAPLAYPRGGQTIDPQPLDEGYPTPKAQRELPHCTPLIGARAGRPLLWGLFLVLLAFAAGRTKRRQHAHGSTRQEGRESRATLPPSL